MLRGARTAAFARVAAAIVAATLSGAPRVLALHAPAEAHACRCRARGDGAHACDCALCRKASLAADPRGGRPPSCHGAVAPAALARTRAGGSRPGACVEGTCGGAAGAAVALAGVEPFCLPVAAAPRLSHAWQERAPFRATPHERSIPPETPPPRPA
jgi:hypothetical protein